MLCKKPFNGFGCGQCLPCRLNLRRIWTSRIMLEASHPAHEKTSFITLTYDDDHLPSGGSLFPKHTQEFLKRLRNYLPPRSLSYYLVGEYGDDTQRPHYHAAFFGFGCDGKKQRLETGIRCHCDSCELLRKTWQHGNVTADELNEITAAYIAGYVMKKMTSKDDVRLCGRHPEFSRSSRKPAIGLRAVPLISDALSSDFGSRAFQHGDIPVSLSRGKTSVPLGKYLRKKIRLALELERIDPQTGEIKIDGGVPYETLQSIRQEQAPEMSALHAQACNYSSFGSGAYAQILEKIDILKREEVSTTAQKILNVETKHNIYASRKAKTL